MSRLWDVVRADLGRCVSENETSARRRLAIIWREVGLQAILVYRFGRLLRAGRELPAVWPLLPCGWLLYAVAALLIRKCYGISLALTADIGAGFWVGHFGGVEVVNCRLGDRCSVGQQTRVGRAAERDGPQVGNGVWIGAHARIAGPIRVGDGATIAPGARVARNVPGAALVIGDPGRVVFRGYQNGRILPHG
jgi:serine O-acetyltransferase